MMDGILVSDGKDYVLYGSRPVSKSRILACTSESIYFTLEEVFKLDPNNCEDLFSDNRSLSESLADDTKLFTSDDLGRALAQGHYLGVNKVSEELLDTEFILLRDSIIRKNGIYVQFQSEVVPDLDNRGDGQIFSNNKKEQPLVNDAGFLILESL